MARRVGRRGAALAWFGALDLVIGWSLVSLPLPPTPQYQALTRVLPLDAWGWVWIGCGLVCLAHVPVRADRLGFAAAISIFAVWAVFLAASWLVYGAALAWVAAAVWASFSAFTLLIAGWPEPPRRLDA